MLIRNLTNPTEADANSLDAIPDAWDGDFIEIQHNSGMIERKHYAAPVPLPTTYKALTKLQAMALLKKFGNIDDARELQMRKDANLELFWMRWRDDVPTSDINRDSPLTAATLGALVATGYITQAQSDAIMANWPTE